MKHVSFLGAGSWGTALAILCANNGHQVTIWSKVKAETDMLKEHREHLERLPGVKLPDSIVIEEDLEKACTNQDVIVWSVASPFVRSTAQEAKPFIKDNQIIVNVGKGIEENTLMTLCGILEDELPMADVCVLSGPSHAEEVSHGVPTTVVVGAKTEKTAMFVQDVFMSDRFRVYTSPDMIGIELGGALKNVIALAAGILDGMGLGDNTKAALMTRGIAEEAKKEIKQVIEGVNCAKAAMALANKNHVTMPIVEQINAILFSDKTAEQAVADLLMRDKVSEYKSLTW